LAASAAGDQDFPFPAFIGMITSAISCAALAGNGSAHQAGLRLRRELSRHNGLEFWGMD